MSFNNLKKNDVVFSESKGSRVFKLISKKDNHWVVGDMFTKKFDTITESDTFRVVKTENKPKPKTPSVNKRTISLFFKLKAIIFSNILIHF